MFLRIWESNRVQWGSSALYHDVGDSAGNGLSGMAGVLTLVTAGSLARTRFLSSSSRGSSQGFLGGWQLGFKSVRQKIPGFHGLRLEITQHHFCPFLLVKYELKPSRDSRGGDHPWNITTWNMAHGWGGCLWRLVTTLLDWGHLPVLGCGCRNPSVNGNAGSEHDKLTVRFRSNHRAVP